MLQLIEIVGDKKTLLSQGDLLDMMLEIEFINLMKYSCGVSINHEPFEINLDDGNGIAFPFNDNSALAIMEGMNQDRIDKCAFNS
jgi:hypothetical protein